MRLYATKIPVIVDHVYKDLVDTKDVEVSNGTEFRQDVESILREYLRANREFTERAKDLLEAQRRDVDARLALEEEAPQHEGVDTLEHDREVDEVPACGAPRPPGWCVATWMRCTRRRNRGCGS